VTRSSSSCSQFGIDFDYDVGTVVISLHGELDALSVPAFGGVLRALAERGTRSVTIDLSELRFCNVGGLRVMAELATSVNALDGRVEIRSPAILTRMLDISELHSLFVIVDGDRDAGVGAGAGAVATRSVEHLPVSRLTHATRSSRPRVGSRHRLSTGP
jgi:anti-anti-sigma factor